MNDPIMLICILWGIICGGIVSPFFGLTLVQNLVLCFIGTVVILLTIKKN